MRCVLAFGTESRRLVALVVSLALLPLLAPNPGLASARAVGTRQDEVPVPGPVETPVEGIDPVERAARVARLDSCKTAYTLYAGESHTLTATALDVEHQPVHGVVQSWAASDESIATVTSYGEVYAALPGRCMITVRAGAAELVFALTVVEGVRRVLSDEEWDRENPSPCAQVVPGSERLSGGSGYVDGSNQDPFVSIDVVRAFNSVGSPLHDPQHVERGVANRIKKNLGSDNFQFVAPVLSLPGRGIDLNLGLSYNSRVWSKDTAPTPDKMTFNHGKGWPAVGWRIGFGRIREDYDTFGNHLLILGDGSRVHLQKINSTLFQSTNGTYLELRVVDATTWRLRYPDGTRVSYEWTNNRWLPKTIRTTNGNLLTIEYKTYDSNSFKYRWAIYRITDTAGRVVTFHYNGANLLSSITAPDYQGGTDQTLVELGYDDMTLAYNFGSMTVDGVPNLGGGTGVITVLTSITYTATGRGYVFEYSPYGMIREISNRVGMVGTFDLGNEIASTELSYLDTGVLSDAPRYSTRTERWLTTSETSATPTTVIASYDYARTTDAFGDEVDSVTYPSGLVVKTTSGSASGSPDFGRVKKVESLNGSTLLHEVTYTYGTAGGGEPQVTSVVAKSKKDNGTQAQTRQTDYEYWSTFGRVKNVREYLGGTVRRRTYFEYQDGTGYTDENHIVDRVTKVEVYNGNDVIQARTTMVYDNYSLSGGLENYGITSSPHSDIPPGFSDTHIDTSTSLKRGIVVRTSYWSNVATNTFFSRDTKYDIFGNVVQAEVSCCALKKATFIRSSQVGTMHYTQPATLISSDSGATLTLDVDYGYDANTGLTTSMTDVRNKVTVYGYDDASWRPTTVTRPALSGETDTTSIAYFDGSSTALPTVTETTNYTDVGTKTITSKAWFDGAGRALRQGTGSGSFPTAFDCVMSKYDTSGRVERSSLPYAANSSGLAASASNVKWTVLTYDALARVREATMPDGQKVSTLYEGSLAVQVSDPAGRTRRSEFDDLGRMVKVVEHNPSGTFSPTDTAWKTDYTYDTLDNLTGVDQGGQTRSYVYDSLSRMTSQTTPEGGLVSYVLEEFGSVRKMTDARNVETHYRYDGFNRLVEVWYTGLGGNDSGTVRPSLPTGVEQPGDLDITYSTSGNSIGQITSIVNGAGTESFAYDALGRVTTRTWTMDGTPRATSYTYTAAHQVKTLTYPTNRVLTNTFDARGRLSGLSKTNAPTSVYISSVAYDAAGNVTSLGLDGNVTETYGYDPNRLQLTSQTVQKTGQSPWMSLTYNYTTTATNQLGQGSAIGKNAGQLLSITGTLDAANAGESYTYDTLGRLKTAQGTSVTGGPVGTDTIGTYAPSTNTWFLRNTNTSGSADVSFSFGGSSTLVPIEGDWDGDGDDTAGLYDPATGTFHLKNANSDGLPDLTFLYGGANRIPIAGDWDGDGDDTIGVYDPTTTTFFLRNSNSEGSADLTFSFGASSSTPIAGDWDGDGDDTIGTYVGSTGTFFLRNANSGGSADMTFSFGADNSTPLVGDWDGDGDDTIGTYVASTQYFFLRNTNSSGAADLQFSYGASGSTPLAGDWDGASAGVAWARQYIYDRWGNRTEMKNAVSGGTTIQTVFMGSGTPTNRVVNVNGGPTYVFDGVGNLTDDGVYKYRYDAANRLVAVVNRTTSTDIERYKYDASNRRMRQEVVATGTMLRTVWEGAQSIIEYSGSSVTREYIYAGSRLLASEESSLRYFHHPDRLSTRLVSNSSSVAGRQSHLPFGETGAASGLLDKHRFTNYERDALTDSDYAMNRQYMGGIGRFARPDPIAGSLGNPQRLNRYSYSLNDPVNLVDPSGLSPFSQKEAVDLAFAIAEALKRLKNPDCAKAIRGDSKWDPTAVLIHMRDNKQWGRENFDTNNPYNPASTASSGGLTTGRGKGKGATITLYDPFFVDDAKTITIGDAPGYSPTKARAFILLHELRHAVAGKHHNDEQKTQPGYELRSKFNEKVITACLIDPTPVKKEHVFRIEVIGDPIGSIGYGRGELPFWYTGAFVWADMVYGLPLPSGHGEITGIEHHQNEPN